MDINGQPPSEVWYIEYRWLTSEATGRDARFFGTRGDAEDFLHFCYVSQYHPGQVLAPTGIWALTPAGWVQHEYNVQSVMSVAMPKLDGEEVTTKDRGFATISDAQPDTVHEAPDGPPTGEAAIDLGAMSAEGVIRPEDYLPKREPEGD